VVSHEEDKHLATTAIPETISAARRRTDATPLHLIYALEPLAGAAALAAAIPLIAALAVAIAFLSRRSPLVRHVRVGWRGATLPMLKLRTMWDRPAASSHVFRIEEVRDYVPELKSGTDPRVTSKFAAWCRRYSLDELPQLYHVATGEMSIVGPRPITRPELEKYYGASAGEVLLLRPGLVGLWQVMGRNHLTYARRRRLDLLLVRRASPALYLRVLLRAISKVFRGHGAY
jgi:lipopolysaccharide/colanic/teichoic acid biosynthesis glycosyltransferase